MIKLLTILTISICLNSMGYSQTFMLKGNVTDTVSKLDMENAVIYLKKTESNYLIAFTRADSKGDFVMPNVPSGIFILVVTYPGYVDWIDSVNITNSPLLSVPVYLITKAHLLEEVVVRQKISPIRIKGDTTEFFADSFHVKPNATVEDMLRVLPGMSVNGKGQITSNGQRVQNVLVDGEEFFGNDPTLATQNLNKNDIAKVQVYDKKSDKATITGIDDGMKQKTINLVLKDNSKRGFFGELSGGTDFKNYYNTKATISHFTSTMKTGALFIADRTGRDIASFQEEQDFGTSSESNQGIPESIQAAAMLNKKFGALNSSTANNYNYNQLSISGSNYTGTKYVLPDTTYYSKQYGSNRSNALLQIVNSKNEIKIDSFTTLTVNAKMRISTVNNYSLRDGVYLGNDNATIINTNHQSMITKGDNNSSNADVYFKKTFDKKGTRFYTLNTSLSNYDVNTESYLDNTTNFFTNGGISAQQTVDQKKMNFSKVQAIQALASYVTPISKNVSVNTNYAFNVTNTDQDIRTYKKINGKYDSLDLLYSNHYKFINTSHRGGGTVTIARNKITVKAGFALQNVNLRQNNLYKDSVSIRNFTNAFPSVNLVWKNSRTGNINLNYNGRTVQPTLSQLQPVLNNNDPLNIQVGNPTLRPSFQHALDLQFDNYRAVSGRIIRGAASLSLAENDFSSISNIDNQGRRISQTINIDGNYSYYAWVTYGRNLKFWNITASVQPRVSGNRFTSYINGLKNVSDVFSFTPTFYLTAFIDKKLDLQSSYNYEFIHSRSSINILAPIKYHIQAMWMYISYYPNSSWTFSTSYNYNIREKLSAYDVNNSAMIWNLTIEHKLSKKENISASMRVNDILNQNLGFNRAINSVNVTENTYTTFQRYGMLSLRWKFNKNRKSE